MDISSCPIPGKILLNVSIQAESDSAVLVFVSNSVILGLYEIYHVNFNS